MTCSYRMNAKSLTDREAAEWLAMELDNTSSSESSTKPTSLWQRRVQQAAVVAVLVFILISIVLAIALPVTIPRARRAAEAAARAAAVSAGSCPTAPTVTRLDTSNMSLAFEDTFGTFNSSTWRFDLGDGSVYGLPGFGNGEVQCYTNSADNLDLVPNPECPPETDSLLRIRSGKLQQPQPCINPGLPDSRREWTSAKIDTKGKLLVQWKAPQVSCSLQEAVVRASAVQYDSQGQPVGPCGSVIVEARMKVPMSAGRWSAFWMMPEPQPGRFPGCQGECGAYGGWPRSGEIDIMEHVNKDLRILGTLHWGTQIGQHASEGGNKALSEQGLQGWNVYQVRWSCDAIEWYVNGQRFFFVMRSWVQPLWPFDEPFFLILNTAVGGALTGYADADAPTAEMLVDYVRVYASNP